MDKLDIPHSTSSSGNSGGDSMMDYDMTTNDVAFRDWPSLMGGISTNSESSSQNNDSQQQAGWGQMFQYSYDPRVTSA